MSSLDNNVFSSCVRNATVLNISELLFLSESKMTSFLCLVGLDEILYFRFQVKFSPCVGLCSSQWELCTEFSSVQSLIQCLLKCSIQ